METAEIGVLCWALKGLPREVVRGLSPSRRRAASREGVMATGSIGGQQGPRTSEVTGTRSRADLLDGGGARMRIAVVVVVIVTVVVVGGRTSEREPAYGLAGWDQGPRTKHRRDNRAALLNAQTCPARASVNSQTDARASASASA
jgi:hypothetical protein